MVRDDFAARRDNYRTLLHGLGKTHCDGSSAGGDHKKEGRNDSSVSVSAVSACKGDMHSKNHKVEGSADDHEDDIAPGKQQDQPAASSRARRLRKPRRRRVRELGSDEELLGGSKSGRLGENEASGWHQGRSGACDYGGRRKRGFAHEGVGTTAAHPARRRRVWRKRGSDEDGDEDGVIDGHSKSGTAVQAREMETEKECDNLMSEDSVGIEIEAAEESWSSDDAAIKSHSEQGKDEIEGQVHRIQSQIFVGSDTLSESDDGANGDDSCAVDKEAAELLSSMFPGVDIDMAAAVLAGEGGHLDRAVEVNPISDSFMHSFKFTRIISILPPLALFVFSRPFLSSLHLCIFKIGSRLQVLLSMSAPSHSDGSSSRLGQRRTGLAEWYLSSAAGVRDSDDDGDYDPGGEGGGGAGAMAAGGDPAADAECAASRDLSAGGRVRRRSALRALESFARLPPNPAAESPGGACLPP